MAGIIRICSLLLLIVAVNLNTLYAIDNENPEKNSKPLEIISITPIGEDACCQADYVQVQQAGCSCGHNGTQCL